MNRLYEIVEFCLKEIEAGADVDSVLFRYPEYAEELRPILETSVKAKALISPDPSQEVMRRNRAKLLQHAAQLREANTAPKRRTWSVPLRRAIAALAVITVLFVSTNGLVRAASTTLPGDRLYPVKRTCEDVLILFTFNVNAREMLEVEHENERLDELKEVFAEGRSVDVDFSGKVTRQNGDLWLVSGIPVAISTGTFLQTQTIAVGDGVHVIGTTQKDGAVLAQRIELLPAGVPLPSINDDDSFESDEDHSGDSNQANEDHSGRGSEGESPNGAATQTPNPESGSESDSSSEGSQPRNVSVEGVVQSVNGNVIVINNQIMNISSAEIRGQPAAGAKAKVEGYYDANGLFIVTKIEFQNEGSGSGNNSSSGNNTPDDHGTDDSPDNNSGSGGGDDHGGGGNSGSGGGGD